MLMPYCLLRRCCYAAFTLLPLLLIATLRSPSRALLLLRRLSFIADADDALRRAFATMTFCRHALRYHAADATSRYDAAIYVYAAASPPPCLYLMRCLRRRHTLLFRCWLAFACYAR